MFISILLLMAGLALGGASVLASWRWRGFWAVGLAVGVLFGGFIVGGVLGLPGLPELSLERGLGHRLAVLLAVASAVGLPLLSRAVTTWRGGADASVQSS